MADQEKIFERVRLLLRKAESTTVHEAAALREAAEKLIVRYGINRARLEAESGNISTEQIDRTWFTFTGNTWWTNIDLEFAHLVCMGLGELRTIKHNVSRRERKLCVVGFESDLRRAELMVSSLRMQAQTALTAWWEDEKHVYAPNHTRNEIDRHRGAFVKSFALAVRRRLVDARTEALDEVKSTGTDLVLASRQQLVDAAVAPLIGGKSRGTSTRSSLAGFDAGMKARLGGTEINGTRTAIEGG